MVYMTSRSELKSHLEAGHLARSRVFIDFITQTIRTVQSGISQFAGTLRESFNGLSKARAQSGDALQAQ